MAVVSAKEGETDKVSDVSAMEMEWAKWHGPMVLEHDCVCTNASK